MLNLPNDTHNIDDDAIMIHADEEDDEPDELVDDDPSHALAAAQQRAAAQLKEHQAQAAQYLTNLMQTMAEGYRLQQGYQCKE